jgi:hypothetical protein
MQLEGLAQIVVVFKFKPAKLGNNAWFNVLIIFMSIIYFCL